VAANTDEPARSKLAQVTQSGADDVDDVVLDAGLTPPPTKGTIHTRGGRGSRPDSEDAGDSEAGLVSDPLSIPEAGDDAHSAGKVTNAASG
jgi:hypothetical protein